MLAAINKIESNFGQNMGPSSAGAIGWMQFMPSTWARWGVDADGDGVRRPVERRGRDLLRRALSRRGRRPDRHRRAVFSYNHAEWYVDEVLQLAQLYGRAALTQTVDLDTLQASSTSARRRSSARARARPAQRSARAQQLTRRARSVAAAAAALLSDRLAAEHRAVLFDVRVQRRAGARRRAQAELQTGAGTQLATRDDRAPGAVLRAAASGTLMARPSYHDNYVFPVGGGPQLVSVAHTHHDYPAADIAAPAGSPVYALSDATVIDAWQTPTRAAASA